MKPRVIQRVSLVALAAGALLLSSGCYSKELRGGSFVPASYAPEVLVNYFATGHVAAGVSYHLVHTGAREALLEHSLNGAGTLITNRWQTSEGDHYFCWVTNSHGYEFVIPTDRTQPAEKRVHASGYYEVREGEFKPNDRKRPVVVAILTPILPLVPEPPPPPESRPPPESPPPRESPPPPESPPPREVLPPESPPPSEWPSPRDAPPPAEGE